MRFATHASCLMPHALTDDLGDEGADEGKPVLPALLGVELRAPDVVVDDNARKNLAVADFGDDARRVLRLDNVRVDEVVIALLARLTVGTGARHPRAVPTDV